MRKNPEELLGMSAEEYKAYLKTLTPQEFEEEVERSAAVIAEFNIMAASGERKFDWNKINTMSAEERAEFEKNLSLADRHIYLKEAEANACNKIDESITKIAKIFIWFFCISLMCFFGLFLVIMLRSNQVDFSVKIFAAAAAVLVIVRLIFWYLRKKKVERICRKFGFTLVKDENLGYILINKLHSMALFKEQPGISRNIGEIISLNILGQEAYVVEVEYAGSINNSRYHGQALILEAEKNMPYIKIAPKTNFFTQLEFFYKPSKESLEEIKIDKDYNLYCEPKHAQPVLDALPGILPQIKKDKFVVEISGKWIVIMKLGYTKDFDKFVNQCLPIAKAFDENPL